MRFVFLIYDGALGVYTCWETGLNVFLDIFTLENQMCTQGVNVLSVAQWYTYTQHDFYF
jgi:hypothetical protein